MSVRPRIQRAFAKWLEEAQPNLKCEIIIKRRTDQATDFKLDIGSEALRGWVSTYGLSVAVSHQGTEYDLLFDSDAFPEKVRNGYVCALCRKNNEKSQIFANREDLWHDHLFDPFQKWINEILASASSIQLYRRGEGSTWAALDKTGILRPDADVSIPIMLKSSNKRSRPSAFTY